MNEKPLWMPAGSVRSLLALALVLAVIGLTAYLVVAHPEVDLTDRLIVALVGLGNLAVGFYFGSKQSA